MKDLKEIIIGYDFSSKEKKFIRLNESIESLSNLENYAQHTISINEEFVVWEIVARPVKKVRKTLVPVE